MQKKALKKKALNLEFLTASQLANELGLNPQYVRECARHGIIPSMRLGTSWRFSLTEVKKQLELNAAKAVERSTKIIVTSN